MFEDDLYENLETLGTTKIAIGKISGYQGTSMLRSLNAIIENCATVLRNVEEKHLTVYSGDVETIIREVRYFQQLLDGAISEYRHDFDGAIWAIEVEETILIVLRNLISIYNALYIQDDGLRPGLSKVVIDHMSGKTRNHLYGQRDTFRCLAYLDKEVKDSLRKRTASSIYYDVRNEFDTFTRMLQGANVPEYVKNGAENLIRVFDNLKYDALRDCLTAKEYRKALNVAVEEYYLPIKPYLMRRHWAYSKAYNNIHSLVNTYQ